NVGAAIYPVAVTDTTLANVATGLAGQIGSTALSLGSNVVVLTASSPSISVVSGRTVTLDVAIPNTQAFALFGELNTGDVWTVTVGTGSASHTVTASDTLSTIALDLSRKLDPVQTSPAATIDPISG